MHVRACSLALFYPPVLLTRDQAQPGALVQVDSSGRVLAHYNYKVCVLVRERAK
jgi:hypothetical protein